MQGTWTRDSSHLCPREPDENKVFPILILELNYPHPRLLIEKFPAGNQGSGLHCHLYFQPNRVLL
jgi:hypothetical protein